MANWRTPSPAFDTYLLWSKQITVLPASAGAGRLRWSRQSHRDRAGVTGISATMEPGDGVRAPLQVKRLELARLRAPSGEGRWPVHGFVVIHPGGAVLVDTGVGGPQEVLDDWRVVNTAAADALAAHDLTPADISLVINTH